MNKNIFGKIDFLKAKRLPNAAKVIYRRKTSQPCVNFNPKI